MENYKVREIARAKRSFKIIKIMNMDLLQKEAQVILNSVGSNAGYGGNIAKYVLNACGKEIETATQKAAQDKYGQISIPEGEFVDTEAFGSEKHSYVVHAVSPYFNNYPNEATAQEKLTKLIYDVLEYCGKKGIVRLAMPPVSSGICGFPTKVCCKAFFEAIMSYLEKCNMQTSFIDIAICIIEKEKTEEFQKQWNEVFEERYPGGEHKEDSDEESEKSDDDDDDDNDSDEEKKGTGISRRFAKPNAIKEGSKLNSKLQKMQIDDSSSSDEDDYKKSKKPSFKGVQKSSKLKPNLSDSSSDDEDIKKVSKKSAKMKFSVKSSAKKLKDLSSSDTD